MLKKFEDKFFSEKVVNGFRQFQRPISADLIPSEKIEFEIFNFWPLKVYLNIFYKITESMLNIYF